jgi:tetratricopeptide (TPR) repeat protein
MGALCLVTALLVLAGCSRPEVKTVDEIRRLYQSGRFVLAQQEARALLAEEPDNPDARRLLGRSLAATGAYRSALAAYRVVLSDDPTDHEILYEAALLERLVGNNPLALRYLEDAVSVRPEAAYLDALARGHMELGRYDEAADTWDRAISARNVSPDMKVAFMRMRARALLENGEVTEAQKTLRQALMLKPEDEDTSRQLDAISNN